ncbi:MAG: hypothetical protein F6K16_20500 [Symploca sp. SIO2B6]|nr:hypothetical protein [Symploca sp. SIO2B6]
MRIGLLLNHWPLLSILEPLIQKGWLVGLAAEEGKNELVTGFKLVSQQYQIPYIGLTKTNFANCLSKWLEQTKPDVVLVSTLAYKIPADLLQIPTYGFFNFHYGLLPNYRGPDTIFWPIRNQEACGGFTIHKMDSDWDTGAIAHLQPVPIEVEDTHGLYLNKLAQMLPQAAIEFIDNLSAQGDKLPLVTQEPGIGKYWSKPSFEDLCIRWHEQSAREVHALVRASNPRYGGAVAFLRGVPLHILQVSLVEQTTQHTLQPGEIAVTSSEEGTVVCSQDGNLLRLDAVQTPEGLFTGNKLPTIFGIQVGEVLSIPERFQETLQKNEIKKKSHHSN